MCVTEDKTERRGDAVGWSSSECEQAATEGQAAIQAKLDKVKGDIQSSKDEAIAAMARVEEQIAEKKSDIEAQIDEWKRNRETAKLEKRAEKAESYAEDSIVFAAYATFGG